MGKDDRVDMWMEYAENDLVAAQVLFDSGRFAESAFHSQQAAEKVLKTLYISIHGELAPRTHRVERLAEDLGAPADLIDVAVDLTADYTTTRYPDTALAMPSVLLY